MRSDNPPLRRVRRYDRKPTPAKPSIIIAQVDGSGTAATSGVSVSEVLEKVAEVTQAP
jgi:hypothetical protein